MERMENNEIKRMNIKEFREKGYLQEANRRFFHPLGIALEIKINEDGEEFINGVWDYRNDKEGIFYDIKNSDDERKTSFKNKKAFIDSEYNRISKSRIEELGFDIEPIE